MACLTSAFERDLKILICDRLYCLVLIKIFCTTFKIISRYLALASCIQI